MIRLSLQRVGYRTPFFFCVHVNTVPQIKQDVAHKHNWFQASLSLAEPETFSNRAQNHPFDFFFLRENANQNVYCIERCLKMCWGTRVISSGNEQNRLQNAGR